MEKFKIDGKTLTAFVGGYLIYELCHLTRKNVKKESTKIKVLEKQSNKNLEKAGVDQESRRKMVKRVNKYEKNAFIKSAFCGFINNDNFSQEMLYSLNNGKTLDVNSIQQEESSNLIRVRETTDEKGRKNVEFLLEIPGYFDPEYGFNLGDYVRCSDRAASHMWERIVITCARPKKKLVGFVGYDRINPENPEERIASTVEVTSEFTENYKRNPESNHDGIYDFVRDYNRMFQEAEIISESDEEVYIEPKEDLLEFLGLTEEDDVRIFEVFMAYKISFPEKFWNPKDKQYQGIDVAKTLECLKYLLKEFRIIKKSDEESARKNGTDIEDIINFDKFDTVMFQSLDPNGEHSLNYYYVIDPKTDEVDTSFYKYGIEE